MFPVRPARGRFLGVGSRQQLYPPPSLPAFLRKPAGCPVLPAMPLTFHVAGDGAEMHPRPGVGGVGVLLLHFVVVVLLGC